MGFHTENKHYHYSQHDQHARECTLSSHWCEEAVFSLSSSGWRQAAREQLVYPPRGSTKKKFSLFSDQQASESVPCTAYSFGFHAIPPAHEKEEL